MSETRDRPLSITDLDDETLLALISRRDELALSSLYERYARLLYSIALRITRDRQAAEEVLQDVFHSVWLRASSFRPAIGSVATWLSGIARNRSIDEVRSRWHRRREWESPLEHLPHLSEALDRRLEQLAVLRADLGQALSRLPALQRQTIELAYFNGLSSTEIAARLREPVGTIKGRLRLGLAKLRELLHPFPEDLQALD
ncbi:sigma-70 family RNA polymerase sigma factor [Kallotenue papyrolyticum]|uniref:sigma-70 family RNA polymerase sigma factor n=1 Tax=Kallotenue papyrolyticum TaxID=1325125 RepID=UPI00049288FE|nr:sigma-70 family RNA polymerase sigma factor [Kallotenue papyrolyticum]